MDDERNNDLLEIIRLESAKPAEESDVVNALWLKDFPNLQYYAPEEFIENRILEERTESLSKRGLQIIPQELAGKVVDIEVNRQELFSGQLALKPEEKQAVDSFVDKELPELPENWQQNFTFEAEGQESGQQPRPSISEAGQPLEKQTTFLKLTEEDVNELKPLTGKK